MALLSSIMDESTASYYLSAWTSVKTKGPKYYEALKEKYEESIDCNELLSILSVLETVATRTVSLLTSDVKCWKLTGVSREIMEEALNTLNIVLKISG